MVITMVECDSILQGRGPITRSMARRLQEDWVKDEGEGPRVLNFS